MTRPVAALSALLLVVMVAAPATAGVVVESMEAKSSQNLRATLAGAAPAVLPPPWKPIYGPLSLSTFDFHDVAVDDDYKFGLTVYGWAYGLGDTPAGTGEEQKIIARAQAVKAHNPAARVMMYLNLELALGWYDEQWAAISDPKYKDILVQYPNNGTIINDPRGLPHDRTTFQAFWDFRNPLTTQYWKDHILSKIVESPHIDGVLFDDVIGFPNEHADIGTLFSKAEVAAFKAGTWAAVQEFTHHLAVNGKYSCSYESLATDPAADRLSRFSFFQAPAPGSTKECAESMRKGLDWGTRQVPFVMTVTDFKPAKSDPYIKQHVAAFLISRGDYAYYGPSDVYDGTATPAWDPILDVDYGTPTAPGLEIAANVFERVYTTYTVRLDCNTYTSTITKTA